jgi:hypothetical protein
MSELTVVDPEKSEAPRTRREAVYTTLSLDSLIGNLPEMVLAHLLSDERVALIIGAGKYRYVQFWLGEKHDFAVECVSNEFLLPEVALSEEDEEMLVEVGFNRPDPDGKPHPNFWWYSDQVSDVMKACQMAAFALCNVLQIGNNDIIKLTERPLSGKKKASEDQEKLKD